MEYYCNKVLLYDVLYEDWAAEECIGFEGKDFFDVLAAKRNIDPESEEYKRAYKTIWRLLTKSTLQKVTHGKNLTKMPALGVFLDKEENKNIDVESGTFAELMRYGSVYFEQTRLAMEYVKAIRLDDKVIIHKGLTEP